MFLHSFALTWPLIVWRKPPPSSPFFLPWIHRNFFQMYTVSRFCPWNIERRGQTILTILQCKKYGHRTLTLTTTKFNGSKNVFLQRVAWGASVRHNGGAGGAERRGRWNFRPRDSRLRARARALRPTRSHSRCALRLTKYCTILIVR